MKARQFSRPRIVISKCIEFDRCRYNGEMVPSEFVRRLMNYADFIPVCMEVEIGLGVPRDPIRVVQVGDALRLVQPSTGKDVTELASSFSTSYLSGLPEVEGFLLKSRSPSCGIKDVKVYPVGEKVASITAKESGFFGREVMLRFKDLAIEDEARLINLRIGEHFLTKLFTLAEYRQMDAGGGMGALVEFHARNKLLMMYYSQKELKAMGRLVANHEGLEVGEVMDRYRTHLRAAMARPPRCGSGVNVLLHAFGYVSSDLNPEEKAEFLDALQKYREGLLPITVAVGMIRAWIARFDQGYLRQQTFLQPYPNEFLDVMSNDACVGRDLWTAIRP
jgi:uncharacterized protein YbgA (DUF1722 family)/uncharacterized protein YbbK (DUF523 family)